MSDQTTDPTPDETTSPTGETDSPNGETAASTDVEGDGSTTVETEPDTFPREYVEQLRDENAKYRQRAGRADDLAKRLHTALVAATGRLADPTDLPFDESHLDDADALTAALDDLLTRKPHLASRRPTGDVGQGLSPDASTVNLAGILRAAAS